MNLIEKTRLLIVVFLIFTLTSTSQVGINTTNPRTTLEVGGDVKISGQLEIGVVEDLEATDIPTLLIKDIDDDIKVFDITNPTGVALGYTQTYIIANPDGDWVLDFDTGISATNYTLNIISYVFNKELVITYPQFSHNFSFPSASAFINNGTWHLKADYPSSNPLETTGLAWTIQTVIFSNDLSKQFSPIEIEMGGNYSGSATTPVID